MCDSLLAYRIGSFLCHGSGSPALHLIQKWPCVFPESLGHLISNISGILSTRNVAGKMFWHRASQPTPAIKNQQLNPESLAPLLDSLDSFPRQERIALNGVNSARF
jgi:hypothetical protein